MARMSKPGDITLLLQQVRSGNSEAESMLMGVVYPELRRIAKRYLRRERSSHTLDATALVNEAYLQLAGQMGKDWKNRAHFFAIAAQLMRRILVDYARTKKALKRGWGRQRVDLTDAAVISTDRLEEIIAIDEALNRLAQWDARQCKVVELRFFAGLSETEVAEVLGVAPRTVKRDWNLARAWLHAELNSGRVNVESPR
jgi:RNA polymerase sigma-70 factor (ECF subfamily)